MRTKKQIAAAYHARYKRLIKAGKCRNCAKPRGKKGTKTRCKNCAKAQRDNRRLAYYAKVPSAKPYQPGGRGRPPIERKEK